MEGFLISVAAFAVFFGLIWLFMRSRQNELVNVRKEGLLPPIGVKPNQDHVKRLAKAGKTVLAIKTYREINPRVGLTEAKEAVEALAADQPIPVKPKVNPAQANDEIQQLIKGGQKIEAIKLYREIHHVGLAEAKTAIENFEKTSA